MHLLLIDSSDQSISQQKYKTHTKLSFLTNDCANILIFIVLTTTKLQKTTNKYQMLRTNV